MKSSGCLYFPFENDFQNQCLKRAETVIDTLISCMKIFLTTKKGSRLGSNFGSIVADLKFRLVSSTQIPELEKDIKTELSQQFPGVLFIEVKLNMGLESEKATAKLYIKFSANGTIADFEFFLPYK